MSIFNPEKSKLIVFGHNISKQVTTCFNNVNISSVTNAVHLGNIIGSDSSEVHVRNLCQDFVTRINFLISQFSYCTTNVKYQLVKRYCMSLFGSVLCDFSSDVIKVICTTWRKCIRRLLNLDKKHIVYTYP